MHLRKIHPKEKQYEVTEGATQQKNWI